RVLNGTLYPANKGNSYLDLSTIYGDNDDTNGKLRDGPYLRLIDRPGNGGAYNKGLKNITVRQVPPSFSETSLVADLTPPAIDANEALVSGDLRCSENIQLCLIHTIWIREHNYWVDQLKTRPELKNNNESLFQQARRIVIAEYQRVVYEEYLPAVLGFNMPSYTGYDETVYADTSTHFAGAAFRYGHSIVRPYDLIDGCTGKSIVVHPDFQFPDSHPNRFYFVGKTVGFPENGNPQNFTKQQLDYTPILMLSLASGTHGDGVDNVLLSMLRGTAAEFDLMVTSSLRNIPGVSDMVSIDIGRGRLLGLLDYNSYRAVYHPAGDIYANSQCDISAPVDPLACFQLITSNTTIAQHLQTIYGKVNRIDAIIGMFAESKSAPTQPLPPTISNILKDEFNRKRAADRF
ncbi:11142_t:CDS:2, partial [Acaulospora colombiana]